MRAILHILTRPADELVSGIMEAQRALPNTRVAIVDLTAAQADYDALLEEIFAAESVEVW